MSWSGSFLRGVHDSAYEEETAGALLVDDEDEGSVEGKPRRRCGEHGGPTSHTDAIIALVDGDDGFMINLTTRRQLRSEKEDYNKTQ